MARTRGAKSSFPSARKRVAQEVPVQGSTSEPPRQVAAPPSAEPASLSPPTRRYQTRLGGRPPQKKARVVDSELIDLTEQSPDPSPEPPTEHQPSQSPLVESQIPSGIAPEVLIKRPMVAQPPIEGNLDYRAQPFHSELCFDATTFKLQPELANSFHLLHRYRMEHFLTPRDFFYPRVAMDFYQSMTTNQHLGYPSDPQLKRRRICREVFTLDKWTNMTAYRAEHPELPQPQQSEDPQPVEIPAARRAYPEPIHEGIPSAFPATHSTPPVIPAASKPSTSAEPRMAIPLSEYRDLCHTLQTLIATQSSLAQEMSAIRSQQEQILTTQTQHTAILRQLQHHLGLPSATEHLTPTTAVPHSETTKPHAPLEPATEDAETST
uniref:Uncharacterized protein n=1 Tax=Vitis vinifera TaxID=29760 RepID=A5CA34_VITVI|nr:hypothetical protein VITISV_021093 [Vitis vinifera]